MLHGLEEGDVKALHRTRVASRRLRELLPVLQAEPDLVQKLSRRLRKVTERLGTVRELDVALLLVGHLRDEGRYDDRALKRLASEIEQERVRAQERLQGKLPTAELRRISRKLEKVAGRLKTDTASRAWLWAVDARVARRASTLKGAIKDAGAVYLADRLHLVRIALKKLRYALEVSAEARGRTTTADIRTLKRSQDLLGQLHDVQVLIDRVRQLQASITPPDLAMWRAFNVLTMGLENDCRRLHGRFMRGRDRLLAICDRTGGRTSAAASRRAAG